MRRSLGAAEDRKRELRWALHAQLQRMTGRPHRSLPSTRSVRYTVCVIGDPSAHAHMHALLCWQSAKPGKLSKREIMEIVCLQTLAKAHPTFYLLF